MGYISILGERVENRQVLVNKSMPTVTNQYTKGPKGSKALDIRDFILLIAE